ESFAARVPNLAVPPKSPRSYRSACSVPVGAKFFALTLHSNRLLQDGSIMTDDPNGSNIPVYLFQQVVRTDDDMLNPGVGRFGAPGFLHFNNDHFITDCNFYNPNDFTVHDGNGVATDENCIGVAHFFPATEPLGCYGSVSIP